MRYEIAQYSWDNSINEKPASVDKTTIDATDAELRRIVNDIVMDRINTRAETVNAFTHEDFVLAYSFMRIGRRSIVQTLTVKKINEDGSA